MIKIKDITILTLTILVLLVSNGYAGISDKLPIDKYTDKYDTIIRKETKRNFSIGIDHRWFKSQIAAESNFNPNAVSPVGAKGLMQCMDPTMRDIVKRSGYIADSVFTPRWAIAAGIYYDKGLYKQWSAPRPEIDRISLMMCSYNSGLKYPLMAQKICSAGGKSCNLWNDIKSHAHEVNGWIYLESLNYVKRIRNLMNE